MHLLNQKANEVIESMNQVKAQPVGFDPSALIAIITTIIQLFQGCNKSPQAAERIAANPGLLHRLKLRRLIREHVHDRDDEEVIFAALSDAGEKLTSGEIATLYTEV